jgi:hypothetical protein
LEVFNFSSSCWRVGNGVCDWGLSGCWRWRCAMAAIVVIAAVVEDDGVLGEQLCAAPGFQD